MAVVLASFVAAATPLDETAAPGANKRLITVPAGVTTAHMGIIMAGNASGGTATLTATGWTALVSNQTDGNETWTVLKRLGGQTAGDTISLNPGTQSVYNVVAFWLDTGGMDVDVVGTPQVRASSIATTTAPSITISQDEPVLILSTERTTATGTTVTDPAGATRLYYHEGVGSSPNVSHYAAIYDPGAAGATPAQTLTYSGASGNGAAVQIALLPQATPLTGGAAINLTAGGSGQAAGSGAAALNLTAAGMAAAPVVGGAALALSASGTTGGSTPAAGTAALAILASGAAQSAPAGAAQLALTASGAAAGIQPATGSAALTLTAAGAGSAPAAGGASLNLTAFSVSPTLVQSWLAQQPLYVAHRGGSADWPEETLYAYGQSAAWNSSLALEVSVWMTTDGVWVCSHDQTTGRVFSQASVDITTVAWSQISGYTTIQGNQPIARLDVVLNQFATGSRVFMIDDKGQQAVSTLLNLLDTYGGASRFIAKGYITATAWADAASARGYQGWGYGYDADVQNGNMTKYQSHWSTLGMDVLSATAADWALTRSFGKVTFGHIIATGAQGQTSFNTFGSTGIVASGVKEAVPNNTSTGTAALNLTAAGTATSGPAAGTAALSLSATGGGFSSPAAAPLAGTAQIVVTAAGRAGAAGGAGASIILTATASVATSAGGAASLALSAAGAIANGSAPPRVVFTARLESAVDRFGATLGGRSRFVAALQEET